MTEKWTDQEVLEWVRWVWPGSVEQQVAGVHELLKNAGTDEMSGEDREVCIRALKLLRMCGPSLETLL